MDLQIRQAVEIALSGTADPALKSQAIQFVNEVKSTEEGYNTCVRLLLESSEKDMGDGLKFFIIQVIQENLDRLSLEQLEQLNQSLFKHLHEMVRLEKNEETYLKNKLSEVFGHLFCLVYPSIDTGFLKTLLTLSLSGNILGADYYIRILGLIHLEIGDKLISRTKIAQSRMNALKDLIRERDMALLVTSWKDLLTSVQDQLILNNTLEIVGSYVSWMDISLFVDAGLLNVVYDFLKIADFHVSACLTLVEIISKKMPPENKLRLLQILDLTIVVASLKPDNIDVIENVAKLASLIGVELDIILENDTRLLPAVNEQYAKLWPTILEFLGHEYDDVLQQVFPFVQHYLALSKTHKELASENLISTLLAKIIEKMKFDDDDDGLDDDDEFGEIRKALKIFQDTVAATSPQVFLDTLPRVIENAIFGSASPSWNSIELGLYELNNFADALRNNLINLPKAEISNLKPQQLVQQLLVRIIENFHLVSHPKNQLAFFELIIRQFSSKTYVNTTSTATDKLVASIIELFSSCGLFNGVESVRLRSWYLFFRFVNATRPRLDEFSLENLLVRFLPLLEIKAEMPTRDDDDDLVEHGNFNSQLYLFEALGMLVAFTPQAEAMAKFVDVLFQPLFSNLESCISREDKAVNPLISLQAHHSLMAIATIIKGLDSAVPGKSESIQTNRPLLLKVLNAAEVVIVTLENFNKFEPVRDAARFTFARIIPVLKLLSSDHIGKLVRLILGSPQLQISELGDFLGFVGQMVHLFPEDDSIYHLLNDLLTPLMRKTFEMLMIEDENYPNLVREKYGLKRALLNLISMMVMNHSFGLFLTDTNNLIFPQVLEAVVNYSCDLGDASTTKLAVTQFGNVVGCLGCNGGKVTDNKDIFAASLDPVDGIDNYLMENTVKMCFEMPFKQSEFDLADAQMRNIAQELSVVLKTYQGRSKQLEFVSFLGNYMTNMGLSQDLALDFCGKLVELDSRKFKTYYANFLSELKK